MSSKWKSSYESGRKYSSDWEKDFPWVRKSPDGQEKAYCKFCKRSMLPKKSSLKKHEGSDEHKRAVPHNQAKLDVKKTPREKSKGPSQNEKERDIKFSVFAACHTAIRAVDHLTDMINEIGEFTTGKLRLHRTKCTCVINNVISPALKIELKKAVQGKKFVIMVDESTDVSCQKLLCVTTSFWHETKGVTDDFVGLIPVTETNASTLFAALEEELGKYNMKLENCIGFASDGANVMVGSHNSVWSRIKEKSPNCVQLKCICHSLALCVQHAFEKMPSNLGFLLKEIPNWFSHSALRRESFTNIFDTINADNEKESGKSHPTPFAKTSQTRWLVRGKVLYNILVNWEELVGYFMIAEIESQSDSRFKARLLKEMLQDKINRLLFEFVTPVVQEFERVNAMFQTNSADPHTLMTELDMLYRSLKQRLYNEDGSKKTVEESDLGCKFETACEEYLENVKQQQVDFESERQKILNTKIRCHNMLEEALQQVQKRLPASMNVFVGLSYLSPKIILSQADRVKFKDLPFKHLMDDVNLVEQQYRKIIFKDWNDEPMFKDGLPTDSAEFWEGVIKTTGFQELAVYALNCLITPVSNANIERVFSVVNATKTKPRNRLNVHSLDAIIRIKAHLFLKKQCCVDFEVTKEMVDLFTADMYHQGEDCPSGSSQTASNEENYEATIMDSWFVETGLLKSF